MDTLTTEGDAKPRMGLAIASLVLSLLACILSFLVIGGLLGLLGVGLGAMHLAKRQGPGTMAKFGVGLSIVGILMSVGFAVLYVGAYQRVKTIMSAGGGGLGGADFAQWQGVKAPDFTVTTLDGKTLTLSELAGKRVIVDCWATWCPPCVREIPHFVQLYKETPPADLVIVGISHEDADTLKAFVKEKGVPYAIASSDSLPEPYGGVTSIPTTFFIDRHGIIQDVTVGYHDFDALKALALAADTAGEPKAAPLTIETTPVAPTPPALD